MSKILAGVVIVLMGICAFLYYQNKSLNALNQAFEVRDAEQKLAIESLQNDFKLQTEGLVQLQSKNQEIKWK